MCAQDGVGHTRHRQRVVRIQCLKHLEEYGAVPFGELVEELAGAFIGRTLEEDLETDELRSLLEGADGLLEKLLQAVCVASGGPLAQRVTVGRGPLQHDRRV